MRRLDRPSSRRAAWAALATAAIAACQDAPLGPASADPRLPAPSLDVQAAASSRPLVWYLKTADGFEAPIVGVEGDVPVPADYDGDGVTDPTVFQPATGTWRIMRSGWQDVYDAFFGQAIQSPSAGSSAALSCGCWTAAVRGICRRCRPLRRASCASSPPRCAPRRARGSRAELLGA